MVEKNHAFWDKLLKQISRYQKIELDIQNIKYQLHKFWKHIPNGKNLS